MDPHLSSNKAGSLDQADHDPAGAKSGPQLFRDFTLYKLWLQDLESPQIHPSMALF